MWQQLVAEVENDLNQHVRIRALKNVPDTRRRLLKWMGFDGTIDVKRKPSARAIKAAWEWESQTWCFETMRDEWKEAVADISWLKTAEWELYWQNEELGK
tara:strand:- start:4928 stop:5227 length:300 start_codon:yes stop_codon:yes gene_type:complete